VSEALGPASIEANARPRLPRGVRLVNSEAQGGFVLLAPERVFKPDPIALAILQRCTGAATLSEIVDDLAASYSAPRDRILADVTALLRGLADKRLLEL
jgi:pyrroloquinoline quinone biosynthesis protein D